MLGNIEPATLTVEFDEDSDQVGKVCLEGSPSCLLDENSAWLADLLQPGLLVIIKLL